MPDLLPNLAALQYPKCAAPIRITMKLIWSRIQLKLADVFRTAKARRTDKETLWVKFEHEGVTGWGEAVPMDTYRQTLDSAEHSLQQIAASFERQPRNPLHIEDIVDDLLSRFDDQRATVAAVDAALHDWAGKRHGMSVVHWLGLDPARIPPTSFTLGIVDDPDALARKVRSVEQYPILKVKLGTDNDLQALTVIRQNAPDKILRVDANAAWTVEQALKRIPELLRFDIEFVEQPIPAGDIEGLRRIREANLCPIVADESCVRPADVVALRGCVDGINIKLSKCGGIREAIRMIHLARGMNMKIMLGCMVESSLGISAAASLAPLVDWLDLDGHLLLSEEPFAGVGGAEGKLTIGGGKGLGIYPRMKTPETVSAT